MSFYMGSGAWYLGAVGVIPGVMETTQIWLIEYLIEISKIYLLVLFIFFVSSKEYNDCIHKTLTIFEKLK